MTARRAIRVGTLAAAIALLPAAVASASPAAGSSTTYRDRIDDAGRAPDIETVTLTQVDASTLGVTIDLAKPTSLGRYGWIVVGIDTDRNQRTGGMHGSEAVVLVNGEDAVLFRLGTGFTPVRAELTGTELAFTLRYADLGARSFDFAVATLRQDADVAPDRGVFTYPTSPARHAPAPGHMAVYGKR